MIIDDTATLEERLEKAIGLANQRVSFGDAMDTLQTPPPLRGGVFVKKETAQVLGLGDTGPPSRRGQKTPEERRRKMLPLTKAEEEEGGVGAGICLFAEGGSTGPWISTKSKWALGRMETKVIAKGSSGIIVTTRVTPETNNQAGAEDPRTTLLIPNENYVVKKVVGFPALLYGVIDERRVVRLFEDDFVRETAIQRRLGDDHGVGICKTHVETTDGTVSMLMSPGTALTMKYAIAKPQERDEIGIGLMRHLLAIHRLYGVYHCDVKPSNILIFVDTAKKTQDPRLIDYGLAYTPRLPHSRTCRQLHSTWFKMPDMITPEKADSIPEPGEMEAADWWALAVTLALLYVDSDLRTRYLKGDADHARLTEMFFEVVGTKKTDPVPAPIAGLVKMVLEKRLGFRDGDVVKLFDLRIPPPSRYLPQPFQYKEFAKLDEDAGWRTALSRDVWCVWEALMQPGGDNRMSSNATGRGAWYRREAAICLDAAVSWLRRERVAGRYRPVAMMRGSYADTDDVGHELALRYLAMATIRAPMTLVPDVDSFAKRVVRGTALDPVDKHTLSLECMDALDNVDYDLDFPTVAGSVDALFDLLAEDSSALRDDEAFSLDGGRGMRLAALLHAVAYTTDAALFKGRWTPNIVACRIILWTAEDLGTTRSTLEDISMRLIDALKDTREDLQENVFDPGRFKDTVQRMWVIATAL